MPKPRILFVEDEDYIARVIKSSLEDAGYEVFRANSRECQDFCVWGGYSRGSPTRLPFVFL